MYVYYITNKIPFLDVYGDMNLPSHVIKAQRISFDRWTSLCYKFLVNLHIYTHSYPLLGVPQILCHS